MLNHLEYSVVFPTNGITLNGVFKFQPGVTAVTGPNGTGKSFGTVEMVRYMLYGKKALRGPASDYKQLSGKMFWSVGGKQYQVERGKKEKLIEVGHDQLAVGTEAVNEKILEIMGFPLEVFDIVCCANQKQSDRLSKLKPTERKKLVDEIVGLTAQEAVEKACRDEAKSLKKEADLLLDTITPPKMPSKPAKYKPAAELKVEIEETKTVLAERRRIQTLRDQASVRPTKPVTEPIDLTDLEHHEQQRYVIDARRVDLQQRISHIPLTKLTKKEIDQAEALRKWQVSRKLIGVTPSLMPKQIEAMLDRWDAFDMAEKIADLELTCQKCGHKHQTKKLPEPSVPREDLQIMQSAWKALDELGKPPPGLPMSDEEIRTARKALDRAEEREKLLDELEKLKPLEDKSEELEQARAVNTQWEIYEQRLQEHMAQAQLLQGVKMPAEPKQDLDILEERFVAARVYEAEVANYDTQKTEFDRVSAIIEAKTNSAAEFKKGAEGLASARKTLKAYLAPSLSRVASALIRQMTNGKLQAVAVDEEMNIEVDGQDIATLSGAGSTVANLAVRLGLGQVLVSRIFPVFLGDEIDADMDSERTEATIAALANLKDQLKQIILVSHKTIEGADHEIVMK